MSIDNRVVKLQFDNAQFEAGVSQSMKTIDELEDKLQFKKSAKGFQSLQNASDTVTFEKLAASIESINSKLSATGVLAAKFVNSIADTIVSGVKKVEAASIGQMKTGGWNRAMNIENAKFAVQGLKGDWDELNKAIDYSVSGTAYGFDEAAKAASTFMASGVDYSKMIEKNGNTEVTMMHKALRAISGVAAQTNSSFSDISHIFTTVAGNGRLMADQLNQLSGRGMNAAAILGEQLHMSEAAVREATSKGQISFEVFAKAMDDAFGEHAKDANKTFTGSLSNMKAALSRFGAVFATPIIQKTNTFFVALTQKINEMKKAIADVTENGKVLEEHLESHFAKMWENLIKLGSTLVGTIDLTWFRNVADGVDKFTQKLSTALEIMNAFASDSSSTANSAANAAYDLTKITKGELDMTYKIIRGEFAAGQERKRQLEQYIKENNMSYDPKKLQAYVNVMARVGYILEKSGIKVVDESTEENEKLGRTNNMVTDTYLNMYLAVTNFNKTLSNLRNSIGQYLTAITEPFGGFIGILSMVTHLIKEVGNSFNDLVNAIKPTEGVLLGVYSVGEAIGQILSELISGVETLVRSVGKFVLSVMDQWKESGILQAVLYDLSETLKNLWHVISNIGVSIGRIFKAIATAFFTVFNPAKATGLVSAFTGSLATLSDQVLLSEDAAEELTECLTLIFGVIEGIVSAIASVVTKIFAFIGSFKNADAEVEVFTGTVEETGEVIEETGEQIEGVVEESSKLVKVARKVKDFFVKLFDTLSQNAGVIRLKEAFVTLGNAFKTSVKDGAQSIGDTFKKLGDGKSVKLSVEDVANGIGWLADKIAILVENIPGAITAIENFFSSAYNSVKNFFSNVKGGGNSKDGAGSFGEGVKNDLLSILGFGKDFAISFAKSAKEAIGFIAKALNGITWKDVIEGAFFIGAAAFITKIARLMDSMGMMFRSVSSLISGIRSLVVPLQKSLMAVARAFSMASFSVVILSIAFAFIGIAIAIKMIAEIPESGMYRAVAVVLLIGAILAILMGIYSAIKKSAAKIQEERTKQLGLVGKFDGIVLTIFAVAAIFYALSKVIGELINAVAAMSRALNEVNDADIAASFMMILGIIFFILILSVVMLKSSQQLVKTLQKTTSSSSMLLAKGKVMYGFLAAMGIFMAGIGVGISMIVDAAVKLTESDHDITQAMGLMLAMIAALLFGTAAVLYASKDVKPKALLTVAVLMLELIVGVVILFGAIFVIAAFMSLEQFAGIKDKISEAGTLMAMVLLSLAVSVMLIGIAVRTITSAGGTTTDASAKIVTKIMLGMIVLMVVIVAGIALIAKEMSGLSKDQQQSMITALTMVSGLLIGLSVMIVVILAIISKMKTKALQNASKILLGMGGAFLMILVGIAAIMYVAGSTGIADNTTAMIVITGSIVLIMAVMAIVFNEIAKSMKSMNTPVLDKIIPTMLTLAGIILVIGIIEAVLMYVAKDATLGDIVTFVIMIAAMGLIAIGAVKLAKEVNKLNSHAGEKLIGLAAAVAAFGVAMFLLSAACKLMNDVDPGSILKLLGLVLGMVAIITLFALVVGKVPAIVTGFNAIKNTLLGIAAAFLIFGVAMIASAAGISMMAPALMEFADAFNYVGTAIEQHSGVAIGIGVLIVVILLVVAYTILKTLPVINRIVTAVVQAVTIIGKVLAALGKGIIKGIDNFANGTQLHRTITAGIAGLIVAAASALTKAGPTVLQRIGDIVVMVIDWLIDAIPAICEKLLQILLKIIFGLCDAIFRNINKISAAISSVVLALGAVIATVIRDVVRMLLYGIFGENAVTKNMVDAVGTACTGAADRFRSMAQDITKDAEEMDKAIAAGGNAVDAWNMNHQDYMSDVAEGARKTGENIRELNEQLANKSFEKYARLHRINFDNAYLYAEKVTGLAEDVMDAEVMAGDAFYAQNDKGIEEFFRVKIGDVSAFQKGNHEYYKIGEKLAKSLNAGVSDNVDAAAAAEQSNTEKLSPDLSASFGDKLGDMLGMGGKKDQEEVGEEAGTNILGGLTDKLGTGFSNIVGGGSGDNPISNLTSGFKDKLGDTGMLGGISFGEGVDAGMMTTLPDLTDTSKFMGEDLSSSLTDGFSIGMVENQDQVEAAGSAVINTTAAEMTSAENQAKMKEAGEMSTASYAWALSLNKGKMMAAGRNIVDGMRIPIEEFADDDTRDPRTVGYFGKRICDILINTIEGHEGLDIGSPSKKMRQIGNFVVQGLTEGIYDEENGAINSMTSLSNMMLNSFTNPIDYVRNIANGTYSYDPSIRPVLDTSLISRGAYGINSMFDHQNVTLNGLSGSIAADIGQLDGSNAEIIAELRALRGDMTAMGEQIAGMQVVMDSGRLVGAISADMDRALGSRATANLRGKGN